MTKEAKKATKLEKKLKILTGGYQVCLSYCVIYIVRTIKIILKCFVVNYVHTGRVPLCKSST